ncbi:MAG: hypothetical protein ACKVH0_19845 [Alphaproteobacteria bacterium]
MRKIALSVGLALLMTACAGRTPEPVAIAKVTDHNLTCQQARHEIAMNGNKVSGLREVEQDIIAHNLINGAAAWYISGLFLFNLDLKDAASKEREALQLRNHHLHAVADERCTGEPDIDNAIAENQSQILLVRRR